MVLPLDVVVVIQVLVLGLIAGTLGGLLGVGGSTIVIPGLTLVFGFNQHLYQAAAMITNVVVCVPAAKRHHAAGAMTGSVLRWMLPLALVFVLVGVWLSNREIFRGPAGGLWLGRVLAMFLIYVIGVNIRRLLKPEHDEVSDQSLKHVKSHVGARSALDDRPACVAHWTQRGRSAWVGAVMGMIAGLLGVGGGAVAVPLQQIILKLPLRSCIANSSAIICVSATLGAVYKNMSLDAHGYAWQQSLTLAMLLAPSCWLGGHLGAGLTHRLPVRQVRAAFVILMAAAAIKMAAIF